MSGVEETPALIAVLAEQCRTAAGQRTSVSVRRLLAAYRAERRGRHVLARIHQDLQAAGLSCELSADEPPSVDDRLDIRLIDARERTDRTATGVPRWTPLVIVEYAGRQCVGVIVDRRGLVASSALLAADAVAWGARATVTVRSAVRDGLRLRGRVAATDRDSDVMLIWLATDEELPAFEPAPALRDEQPRRATLVSGVAGDRLLMDSTETQLVRTLSGRRLRCSTAVTATALGGPLLIDGAVVGIINRRGTQHCYAVPVALIGLLRERAELQRRYLLRALRCNRCNRLLSDDAAVCDGCGRATDSADCAYCGSEQPLERLHECCATCGRVLDGDEDGLTQLACPDCQIDLDDVQLRCDSCLGLTIN
jgi:hypothetical protein